MRDVDARANARARRLPQALALVGTLSLLAVAGLAASGRAGAPHSSRAESAYGASRVLCLRPVVRRLIGPVAVAFAPSAPGTLYIVERRGLVRVSERRRLRRTPFLDLRSSTSTTGERGLLALAFAPDYAATGLVYALRTDRAGAVTLVELRASDGRARPVRTLLRIPHEESPYHNGGDLAFGSDGLLYVSVGDGGYYLGRFPDPDGNSQNPGVLLGKLFRLDVRSPATAPEVVAVGLRNPWRFSFDRANGDLLVGDVGWNGFEEVNLLAHDASRPVNFGWSVYEGRRRRETAVELDTRGRLVFPIATYATRRRGNCSIVGGYVYRGRTIPVLRGRYVYGDHCSGRVWSLRVVAGRAAGNRLEAVRVPRLVSFAEDAAGELYAVSLAGAVYRFAKSS